MVVATDFPEGKLRVFNPHSRFGAGEWIGLGDFTSPRGVALDSFGRLLVADYQPGRVHVFGLTSSFGVQSVRAVPGLSGPRYVCGTPDGGFAVSEECGDVKVYDANHKLLHTLGKKYGHSFGSPAGVCVDAEGSLLVSDEQRRCVVLFPASGSPVPVVSEGLRRPAGLACCNRGRLYVADAADHCVKVFQYRGEKHRRKDTSPDPSPSNREA
ncbi:NHLC4 protein, partial [Amia calva]|nr:NHLC4 protein [Amia calva]